MNKIKPDQYMIIYDTEVGIVYAPNKGEIQRTTPEHARAIEECLSEYFSNKMTDDEKSEFENYLEKSFKNIHDLPLAECPSLLEREGLRRLTILVATDCNLSCKYCYAHCGTYGNKRQRMTPQSVSEYLEKLIVGRYRYVEIVQFFGGEPALCPETMQEVCDFFEEKVRIGTIEKMPLFLMVSNGTLIDEKIATFINKYNVGVTISIDGPIEINDILRVNSNNEGTYSQIVRGINNINKAGSRVRSLEATYTSKHKEMGYTKKQIYDYLRSGFDTDVMVADCSSNGENDSLKNVDWDIIEKENGNTMNSNLGFTAYHLSKKQISVNGCDSAFGSIALLPNGDIYPCHFFIYYPEYKIACYHDGQFDFSNYGNVLQKFYSILKTKNSRCKDCWAKPVCNSCSAQLLLQGDDEFSFAECHMIRTSEKKMILKCVKANLS